MLSSIKRNAGKKEFSNTLSMLLLDLFSYIKSFIQSLIFKYQIYANFPILCKENVYMETIYLFTLFIFGYQNYITETKNMLQKKSQLRTTINSIYKLKEILSMSTKTKITYLKLSERL